MFEYEGALSWVRLWKQKSLLQRWPVANPQRQSPAATSVPVSVRMLYNKLPEHMTCLTWHRCSLFFEFLMINSAVAHTAYWQSSMFQVSTLHFPVNWFRHGLTQRPKEFNFMSAHFCFLQETFTDFYTLTCFIILWVIAANLFPCFCLTVRLPAGARRVSTISWTSSVSWLAVHTRVSLWMSPILLAKT